jgi:flagellin
MALRVNTNASALNSIRHLQATDRAQSRTLERLSSGLRINRGADDPSGLVISEQLRQQISALKQDSQNSQSALNLVNTADNALAKVGDLLTSIQDSIQFALSSGSNSPEQVAAEQDSVDQALDAIDRIANTTRFAGRALLNGSAGYKIVSTSGSLASSNTGDTLQAFKNVNIRSLNFAGNDTERQLEIKIDRQAQRAQLLLQDPLASGLGSGQTTTLRVTGALGAADIVLASGASSAEIAKAVNGVADRTGVFAVYDSGAGNVLLQSEKFGSDQFISLQAIDGGLGLTDIQKLEVSGSLNSFSSLAITDLTTNLASSSLVSDRGEDARVKFDGSLYTAKGLHFNINTGNASFEFDLNADLYHPYGMTDIASGASANSGNVTSNGFWITVGRTGLDFQLREQVNVSDRLAMGLRSVGTTSLGFETIRDVISEAMKDANFDETDPTSGASLFASAAGSGGVVIGGFLNSLRTGQGNDLTQNAGNALRIVQAAGNQVSQMRGFLGAVSAFNLEPNIESIDVVSENLQASLSSLRDLDFAEETAAFARSQILFQSGIAALASSRAIPQAVLQLLG